MAQKPKPPAADEKTIRRLLEQYSCPLPYHEVRARFLGNVVTPSRTARPMQALASLWDGELPEFRTLDDANELIGALINGLWNALTRHQKRTEPFRLTRVTLESTRIELAELAFIRLQELEGFVEGLLDGQDGIDVPKKAEAALQDLEAIRPMLIAVHEIARDHSKPAPAAQLEQTFKHLRAITLITEKDINAVVLACTKARRQMLRNEGGVPRKSLH